MGPKIQLISKEDACKIVANEFSNDWIKQNIYRVTETTKASHMLEPYDEFGHRTSREKILRENLLIDCSRIWKAGSIFQ